jgi:hypothetical protein
VGDDPLDQLGEAVTEAMAEGGAALYGHPNPLVGAIGEWLAAGGDAALFVHVSGVENARGHSARLEAARRRRDTALRKAAVVGGYDAAELSAEYGRYRSTAWLRDRQKPENPYRSGSVRALLFVALRAVDRDLGARQLARILGDDTD